MKNPTIDQEIQYLLWILKVLLTSTKRCQKCHLVGHNSRTCKQKRTPKRTKFVKDCTFHTS